MSIRAFYSQSIESFLLERNTDILGEIQKNHAQDIVILQTNAWDSQVEILQKES